MKWAFSLVYNHSAGLLYNWAAWVTDYISVTSSPRADYLLDVCILNTIIWPLKHIYLSENICPSSCSQKMNTNLVEIIGASGLDVDWYKVLARCARSSFVSIRIRPWMHWQKLWEIFLSFSHNFLMIFFSVQSNYQPPCIIILCKFRMYCEWVLIVSNNICAYGLYAIKTCTVLYWPYVLKRKINWGILGNTILTTIRTMLSVGFFLYLRIFKI